MEKKTEQDLCEIDQREKDRRAHYEAADQNDKMIINLRDISHTMRALSEGRGSQRRILIMILEAGTITQRRLTERLGIQPGSASEVLAKLEKGGLITRTESATDRRTTDIALTDQGKSMAEEAFRQRQTRHEEMLSVLTEEEKNTLLSLLEKLNNDWRERYKNVDCHPHGRCGGGHRGCHGHEQGESHGHREDHGHRDGHEHGEGRRHGEQAGRHHHENEEHRNEGR